MPDLTRPIRALLNWLTRAPREAEWVGHEGCPWCEVGD